MAGTVVGEAFVAIRPQVDGFAQEAQSKIAGPLQAALGGIATGLVANKVKDFFGSAIGEAQEAAKVGAQTAAVLKSTGEAAGVSAYHVNNLANKLSNLAAVDDEVVQQGENVLLTFTSIRNEVGKGNDIFDRATEAALNMSAALGTDLQGSIIQVGKALNDPIAGMTALARVGVSFTESQKAQIKALQESGDLLGAQKLILDELAKEFGGAAASQATDAARLGVAFKNLKESIGTALLPVVSALAAALTPIANFLSQNQVAATALAIVLSGALLAGLVAWTIHAGAAAAATLGLTAASAEGAVAATALGSALGKGAAAAAVGIGTYEATTYALHALFDQTDKVTGQVNALDTAAHKAANGTGTFAAAIAAANNVTGNGVVQGTKITNTLIAFNKVLELNVGAALRFRDEFQNHPVLYQAMTNAIDKYNAALRQQKADTDKQNQSQFVLNATTQDWLNIINSQANASLDSQAAAVSMDQAIQNLNETLFTNKQGTLEVRQATIDAERSVISFGQKIFDESDALHGSEQAARDQVGALAGVRDSLAPGNPLRTFLDQYIDRLNNGIPANVYTQFVLRLANETGLSVDTLRDLDTISSIPNVFQAATGGYFPARAGGYLVNVAEGGQDEVVGTPAQMAEKYGGGGGVHVYFTGAPAGDPTQVGLKVAKAHRIYMEMASR